ncbi:MAG: IS630 family transposase [bacterium]|nr:IS630 family transposase [bacterium]
MLRTDARKLSPDAQEAVRKRAIIALEKGKSQKEVAEMFGVSRISLFKWAKIYKKKGVSGLSKKRQGRPQESCKLKGRQSAWVIRTITDKCPEQLKMPWALWTRGAIQELIKNKFGIDLSISSVSRLLKRWGFTPQKPIRQAYQRNPKVISAWMQEEYPEIYRQAKKECAEIHWCDEMGIRSTDQVGRSFGRRGQTPVIQSSGSRFRCNMISTITNPGTCRFMVFKDRFTVDVYLRFLRKLIYKQERKLFLIVDNHRVHHAKKVRKWLEKYSDKIAVFYLPPYAPELNPDELLNHDVKANALKSKRPKSVDDLKKSLRSFMNSIQKSPKKVSNYFKKAELKYIALAV